MVSADVDTDEALEALEFPVDAMVACAAVRTALLEAALAPSVAAVATELGIGSRSRRLGKLACERIRSGERGRASLTSLSTVFHLSVLFTFMFSLLFPQGTHTAYIHPFLFSSP